jgi:ATP-binding cassette, subfamily C, bacterial CydC
VTTLRRLLALVEAPRSRVALAVVLGAGTVICGVGLMGTAGYLISRAAEQPAVLSLTVAIVGVRFFGLTRPLLRYFERLSAHDLALRTLGRSRRRVYERIEPLAPAQLGDWRDGDLLARLVADVDALQNLYLRGIGPPLVALTAAVVSLSVAAAILPAAAIVLAVGLLTGGIAVPAAAVAMGRRSKRLEAAARGDLTAELVETLRGAPELAVYGRADDRIERLREADRALVRVARRAAFTDGTGDGARLLVTGATVAGVLAVAVSAHASGSLDRVLMATLALLALASFEAVQPLAQAARELTETLAAGRRILELTDRMPAISDPDEPARLPDEPFEIAFEGVRAHYGDGGQPVLDGLDLRLDPGHRVALVGPSGVGKTTVANLLVRFLDPEAGRVTLGGRDLRDYRQEDVRGAIAVAGQDSHLFSTSIRENVRLGRPAATDEDLENALREAQILDWVLGLPEGWDTLVGEEGRELSGGQRQRLVLARALLSDARVLVLDEPTAHLDSETATALMDSIFGATRDRTTLLITHRTEGLEHMDEVHTLAYGRTTVECRG